MQLPTVPFNGVSQYLFPYKVNKKLFKTWFPLTTFKTLTSEDMTKPVYRHTMRPGEGTQYRVGKINPLDYKNPIVDTQPKRGFAQTQSVDSDSIDTSKLSWPVLCRDLSLMESGTPIEELPSMVSGQLSDVSERNFSDAMFNVSTWGNYGMTSNVAGGLVNGAMPSTNRAVAGNLDPANAADGVYAYNGGATINAQLLAAMPRARAANHHLTAAHLRRLKVMAVLGGTAMNLEDPVRPSKIETVMGQNKTSYVYLAHPSSITDLLNDQDFKDYMVTRISVENQPQPLNGADYIGSIYGIDIFECPMLSSYQLDIDPGQATSPTAWNILLGAGALTVGWYLYPQVVMDKDLIEDQILFCSHEQRGQKALKYTAKVAGQPVIEQGIIHSFVKI